MPIHKKLQEELTPEIKNAIKRLLPYLILVVQKTPEGAGVSAVDFGVMSADDMYFTHWCIAQPESATSEVITMITKDKQILEEEIKRSPKDTNRYIKELFTQDPESKKLLTEANIEIQDYQAGNWLNNLSKGHCGKLITEVVFQDMPIYTDPKDIKYHVEFLQKHLFTVVGPSEEGAEQSEGGTKHVFAFSAEDTAEDRKMLADTLALLVKITTNASRFRPGRRAVHAEQYQAAQIEEIKKAPVPAQALREVIGQYEQILVADPRLQLKMREITAERKKSIQQERVGQKGSSATQSGQRRKSDEQVLVANETGAGTSHVDRLAAHGSSVESVTGWSK